MPVNINTFYSEKIRQGTRPSNPSFVTGEEPPVLNPPGALVVRENFTDLNDTPNTYSGQGGKNVAVKVDESGLEFVDGGGADPNAVHYNAADGKNATEKQQARDNIGSSEGITSTLNLTGTTVNNYAKTSNIIELTGSTNTNFAGIVGGTDGEKVLIINRMSAGVATLINESASSSVVNRFSFGANYAMTIGEGLLLRYDGTAQRWVFDNFFQTSYLKNLAGQQINPATASTYLLNLESNNGVQGLLRLKHLQSTANKAFLIGRDYDNTLLYDFRDGSAVVPNTLSTQGAALTTSVRNLERWTNNSTAGAINNFTISDPTITTYVFLGAAPDLTGIIPLANTVGGWRRYTLVNRSGGNMTIRHQSASSTAANRFDIIGAADLTVPEKGVVIITYTQGSRWEITSKNF
jgi:hypothetical protein